MSQARHHIYVEIYTIKYIYSNLTLLWLCPWNSLGDFSPQNQSFDPSEIFLDLPT